MNNARPEEEHGPFVPSGVGDSSITSLADIVRKMSSEEMRESIREQVAILGENGVDLENLADYLDETLWSDRHTLESGLGIDDYAMPTVKDVLKVRLLGLYQVGFHPEVLKRYRRS